MASIGIGIPAVTLLAWILKECCMIEMPGEVQAAVGIIIGAIVGLPFAGGSVANTPLATVAKEQNDEG